MKTATNRYGELRARWAIALAYVVGRDSAFQVCDVLEHTMSSSALDDLTRLLEQAEAHGIKASDVRPQLQRRALVELQKALADEETFAELTRHLRRANVATMRAVAERLRAALGQAPASGS